MNATKIHIAVKFGSVQLLRLPQDVGNTQAIMATVLGCNLLKPFVSVQRQQRVWSLTQRAGTWQHARKSWLPTRCGRLDLLLSSAADTECVHSSPVCKFSLPYHSKCDVGFTNVPQRVFVQRLHRSGCRLALSVLLIPVSLACSLDDPVISSEPPST